jgi:hypothetical protein
MPAGLRNLTTTMLFSYPVSKGLKLTMRLTKHCLPFAVLFVERSSIIECYSHPPPKKIIWKWLQASKFCFINKQILSNKEKQYMLPPSSCAVPHRYHAHACAASKQACFIRLPHSLRVQLARNDNLDCFIKQSNIFIWRKKIQAIYYAFFYNFQSSLNHRANACSCLNTDRPMRFLLG